MLVLQLLYLSCSCIFHVYTEIRLHCLSAEFDPSCFLLGRQIGIVHELLADISVNSEARCCTSRQNFSLVFEFQLA